MVETQITPAQIRKIQTLFTRFGFGREDKKGIILRLTRNRASSTKDITKTEAMYLIDYLEGNDEVKKAYKKKCLAEVKSIYRLSYEIGMCYGETYEDKMMNIAVINKFCRERGTVKKNIKEMDLKELKKTKKQFEAMLQNNINSAVNKVTNKILKETEK